MSALECCRQADSDRSPAAWTSIRPTWSSSSTLLSRAPPGPLRRRRRPGPASRRPHRADRAPPPGSCSPPASSPTPLEWQPPAARWRCAAFRSEPGPSLPAWTSSPWRSAAPCAISPAPPSSTTTRPASCLPGKAAPTPICGHSPAGPPPKPNSWKPACSTASAARTKFTSATTSKFSLRYSDDGHMAREFGEPLRWTRPQHIRPEVPRPGLVPASEHPGRAR